jgi:NADPH-dependent curcumin reductase
MQTRQVVLTHRPIGVPRAEHFDVITTSIPTLKDGQVLVRNEFLSVDPAMRGWVNEADNYSSPVPVGAVMRATAAGTVIESRSSRYRVGERVVGRFGWQEHALVAENLIYRRVVEDDLPLSLSLGVLGPTGISAWFGVKDVLRPGVGDTMVVSTAAGAVGSAAGQIAAAAGCRTVGIAGGSVKAEMCVSVFGYDAAVDYKAGSFVSDLMDACPAGVNDYFDNTAGPITDAVLPLLNVRAAVVICGTAALSPVGAPQMGPRVERLLLTRRARMQGMLVGDYRDRFSEALAGLTAMVRAGTLIYREDVLHGLESAPASIEGLYAGENLGKRVIKLAQDAQ